MKHTARYADLKQTIYLFISEAELTPASYFRLYQLALRGLAELNMDVYGQAVTRRLQVNQNKTATLPGDYISWVKVGVINTEGEVATLRRNTQLSKAGALTAERLDTISGVETGLLDDSIYRNYIEGGAYVNLMGVPGGTTYLGGFDVDEDNGVILLSSDYAYDYVLLEYISSPEHNEDFKYPVQCMEALIAYLRYKNILSLPSGRRQNLGLIDRYRHIWLREKANAKFRLRPFRIAEANDTIRLTNRNSIRS